MSKYGAKLAFNQLAEAYLIASKRSQEAQVFVSDLQREHSNELNDYYFGKNIRDSSKAALKNDLKGSM